MAKLISSSLAPITGPVAEIAVLPQTEVPTPIRLASRGGTPSRRPSPCATSSARVISATIMPIALPPIAATSLSESRAPSSTMAKRSRVPKPKRMPARVLSGSFRRLPTSRPRATAKITSPRIWRAVLGKSAWTPNAAAATRATHRRPGKRSRTNRNIRLSKGRSEAWREGDRLAARCGRRHLTGCAERSAAHRRDLRGTGAPADRRSCGILRRRRWR